MDEPNKGLLNFGPMREPVFESLIEQWVFERTGNRMIAHTLYRYLRKEHSQVNEKTQIVLSKDSIYQGVMMRIAADMPSYHAIEYVKEPGVLALLERTVHRVSFWLRSRIDKARNRLAKYLSSRDGKHRRQRYTHKDMGGWLTQGGGAIESILRKLDYKRIAFRQEMNFEMRRAFQEWNQDRAVLSGIEMFTVYDPLEDKLYINSPIGIALDEKTDGIRPLYKDIPLE